MYTLSEIWIYPIKSLGGIRLNEATVEERGLRYDRRWMVVDEEGRFLTQRTVHAMALMEVAPAPDGFLVTHRSFPEDRLTVPFEPVDKELVTVRVWDDTVEASTVSKAADQQLSRWLGREVKLVMMPEWSARRVDPDYAQQGETVSFADGYPLLVIGQASLDDLNSRLESPLSMRRFRPNLVVLHSPPYAEDSWTNIRIGSATFRGVKPCARCVLTTLDPDTGTPGPEPLRTLATYRKRNNKIYFGMNLLARAGHLAVGDQIELL